MSNSVGPLMAYGNDPECVSVECRRQEDWNASPLVMTKGGCRGWHCGNCGQPSSQQGHMRGVPPEFDCPEIGDTDE